MPFYELISLVIAKKGVYTRHCSTFSTYVALDTTASGLRQQQAFQTMAGLALR